jgi:hypothetical protein
VSLFFYYGSGDLGNAAVRLGSGFALTESADLGTLGMARVTVDDVAGVLDLVGLHPFHVDETACSWARLFTGYFADRTIRHSDSLITGASRVWDSTTADINAVLQFEVIRNSGANRPAETDIERLRWWLGSGFTGPIASGETFVDTSGPVDMDASDYRGRTGADLMMDLSQQSGKNHFVAWSDSANAPLIHYYATAHAINSSTIKISNVLSDVDESTIFAPDKAVSLNRDPSSVYTGVYLQYGTGVDFVYETDAGTEAAIGHKRETSNVDSTVSTAAQATAKANTLLADSATEFDKITVTLRAVPRDTVNLIRAGQRIQVKFTHFPGYTSYTWIRISRRTVRQDGDTDRLYALDLELSNSKVTRGKGRHGPPATQTDDPPDATMCDHAVAGIGGATAAAYTEASGDSSFSFGGAAVYASSKLSPNTAYTVCGCALGCGGYGPGKFEQEIWMTISTSALTDADLGMLVTIGTSTGQGAAEGFVVGIGHAVPTGLGEWSGVGGVGLGGGEVFIPRSELGPTNYLVLAPAWHSGGGFLCADQLVSPCGGPLIGGEAGSGQATTPSVSAEWRSFCGSGYAPWVPGLEEVDGSTSTFTLIDWTGHGTPQARVGPLHMAEGSEYTVDRSAGTVTFKEAPPAYSQVAFRYMVQS